MKCIYSPQSAIVFKNGKPVRVSVIVEEGNETQSEGVCQAYGNLCLASLSADEAVRLGLQNFDLTVRGRDINPECSIVKVTVKGEKYL